MEKLKKFRRSEELLRQSPSEMKGIKPTSKMSTKKSNNGNISSLLLSSVLFTESLI
jgi:hypothetical protein